MKQLLTWAGVIEDITIHKEYQFYGNAHVGFKFKDDAGEPRETLHGTWATVTKGVQPSNTFLDQQETRNKNCGNSDYSKHKIQPWDIWLEYDMNPWDADIQKRLVRTKADVGMSTTEQRILDYEKIIHNCEERIRQLSES